MKHKYYQEQADEAEKLLGNGQEHMKSKHDELKQRAMGHDKWVSMYCMTQILPVSQSVSVQCANGRSLLVGCCTFV